MQTLKVRCSNKKKDQQRTPFNPFERRQLIQVTDALFFTPRFFIRQRKRCADVSSRIECIIDSRVILGGFYHASNSLAWVCECMGSIFIVFFFSFHYGCYKAVQQACVFKCMPFLDFLLCLIFYEDVLQAKFVDCALNLSV